MLFACEILSNEGKFDKLREIGNNLSIQPLKGSVCLVKLLAPVGAQKLFAGSWSVESKNWKKINQKIKKLLYENFSQETGEFYISLADLAQHFDTLLLNHLNLNAYYYRPDAIDFPSKNFTWKKEAYLGEWIKERNAGGEQSIMENPQYKLKIEAKKGEKSSFQTTPTLVSLTISDDTLLSCKEAPRAYEAFAFSIYKINDDSASAAATKNHFTQDDKLELVYSPSCYIRNRQYGRSFLLVPGDYVIVVHFAKKDIESKHLLRVFIKTESELLSDDESKEATSAAHLLNELAVFRPIESKSDELFKNLKYKPLDADLIKLNPISEVATETFTIAIFAINKIEKLKYKEHLEQNFEELRIEHLKSHRLFEDNEFKPINESISKLLLKTLDSSSSSSSEARKIYWKRPSEFSFRPKFILGGGGTKPNASHLMPGKLGDRWLLAALSSLARIPKYFDTVVPDDQSFNADNYAGIFHFRFWRFGQWLEVVIDDLLPVDEFNNLLFCHNGEDSNEMYGPLLEKAYAKLNGSYHCLNGGDAVDALVDLTAGVTETISLDESSNELWEMVFKCFRMHSLACVYVNADALERVDVERENGLVLGHTYTVVEAFEFYASNDNPLLFSTMRKSINPSTSNSSIRLLLVQNAINKEKKWTGKWHSLGADEWKSSIDKQLKAKLLDQLGIAVGGEANENLPDGQFFIAFDDFVSQFDELEFVHVNLNAFYDRNSEFEYGKRKWISDLNYGELKLSGG